jgi:indole-3-glycerol phosphate synthase
VKTRAELPGLLSAGGVLDRIVDAKRARLESTTSPLTIKAMAERVRNTPSRAPHLFAEALARTDRVNIIAEIKRRSPSKGVICEDFDAARIASSYAAAGAAAISVVCEEDFFGGSLDHLGEVREVVELPVLRKDFIIDEYQVYETAAVGADALLLITGILADSLLEDFLGLAQQLGLDALVEVHSRDEMTRAVRAGATIIGVNNRDLTTFDVDLNASMELAALAPRESILVSESGITRGSDIRRLKEAGFAAFLIGEHLMRADDSGRALDELIDECQGQR